jgi:enamine deaminase RidA (YjgF/YER057c/UK114 family)
LSVTVIQPNTVHDTIASSYSHATKMAGLIFVSGQVAVDRDGNLVGEGDVRAQTEQAFANVKAVLEAAGSSLAKTGKLTVFTTKLEYRPIIHEIRTRVFADTGLLPASTLAVVTSLARPEWLVEVEAIALA